MSKRATAKKTTPTPARQLAGFLAKYTPEIAKQVRKAHATLRKQIPGAVEMVYDNYNGLVIGFGPTERPSDAIISILALPEWVTLCFLKGAKLPDPHKILKGGGTTVRHVRLIPLSTLDSAPVRVLVAKAVASAGAFPKGRGRLIIKSVSAKQRPRIPA